MLERARIIEIVVAVGVVLVMLAAMVWVGQTYGNGGLGEEGADAMLATIVGFILLISAAGVALAFMLSDPTPEDEDESDVETAPDADAAA